MKALFIAALNGLKVRGSFGRGVRLSDDYFLTNDPSNIRPLLSETFERVAGTLETEAIKAAPAVIYGHPDLDPTALGDPMAEAFVAQQLGVVNLFLMSLWLVKDNAANVELGFLERPNLKSLGSRMSSNSRSVSFSNAPGEFSVAEFDEAEIRTARNLFATLFRKRAEDQYFDVSSRTLPGDATRVSRVFYFSQVARGASDLGMKIAGYVTCFEALFCTESAELAHKLAERLAFFCGDQPEDRFRIFLSAKAAYSIRSRTVHGDKLSSKLAAQAKEVSVSCDDILRISLHKILTSKELYRLFAGPSDQLDDFLTRMVFGISTPLSPHSPMQRTRGQQP